MAKFARFDPRNKKKNRNKNNSLERDARIRRAERQGQKYHIEQVFFEEDELKDLQPRVDVTYYKHQE